MPLMPGLSFLKGVPKEGAIFENKQLYVAPCTTAQRE